METDDNLDVVKYLPINTRAEIKNENWTSLPKKFPTCYEISSLGRIRYRTGSKIIIHPVYLKGNNLLISLTMRGGKVEEYPVYQLVLMSFNPDYYDGCRVRYRDGNRCNVSMNNMRVKIPKKFYVSGDEDNIKKWKCESKANNSNRRFTDKTHQKITKFDVFRVLEIMSFKCFYCNVPLDSHTWQLDHFTPVSAGGDNTFINLASSCEQCNQMKGALDGNQFYSMIYKIYHSDTFKNRFK